MTTLNAFTGNDYMSFRKYTKGIATNAGVMSVHGTAHVRHCLRFLGVSGGLSP